MLAQAGDVAGDHVFGHFSRFVHRAPVGNATRQRWDPRGVATLNAVTSSHLVAAFVPRPAGFRALDLF